MRRFLGGGNAFPNGAALSTWARAGGWSVKATVTQDGWVMDDPAGRPGWRIEWGPSQRVFIPGHELRLRVDLPQLPDVQALVMDKPLLARLDRAVYAQVTETVQTRLDDETPEEMRWIAMHERLAPNATGLALRDRFGAVADEPGWLEAWLQGPVGPALQALAEAVPFDRVEAEPFVLRLARGQLVLRQAAPSPRVAVLQACVDIAAAAQSGAA